MSAPNLSDDTPIYEYDVDIMTGNSNNAQPLYEPLQSNDYESLQTSTGPDKTVSTSEPRPVPETSGAWPGLETSQQQPGPESPQVQQGSEEQRPPPAYGTPQNQPGYISPQPGYGIPHQQVGYTVPQPGYGTPHQQVAYTVSQSQPGYGAPQQNIHCGMPQQQPAYGQPHVGATYPQITSQPQAQGIQHIQVPQNTTIIQRVQPDQPSMAGHIVFSCVIFWCCNPLFGAIAFCLAIVGLSAKSPKDAECLGKASLGLNIAGIVLTVVIIIISVAVVVAL